MDPDVPDVPDQSAEVSPGASRRCRLLLASGVACLGALMVGLTGGYPSPAIPDLNAHRNPFHVGPDGQSWFSAVAYLGAIAGSLQAGFLVDCLGRKLGLMVALVPYALGWVAVAAATNEPLLFLGRFLTGMSCPVIFIAINVYIVEIAPPAVRGVLVTFNQLSMQLGIFTIYLAGWYVRWNFLTVVCAAPAVLLASLVAPLPETPRWLFMKQRPAAAAHSLGWFRGAEEPGLQRELREIQASLRERSAAEEVLKAAAGPGLAPRFAKCVTLFFLQEFSGINVVRTYTVTIFQQTAGGAALLTANGEAVVIGAAMVLSSALSVVLIDRFRRRVLLVASFLLMALGMGALGGFFLLLRTSRALAEGLLWWLPLASLGVFTLAYSVGCGPLPHAITNELFPTRARGRSYSLCIAADYAFGFLVIKCFPYLNAAVGDHGTFWTFAAVSLAGAGFVFFCVPETLGRSLEQLEQVFERNRASINS